jgi:hypothetical protein
LAYFGAQRFHGDFHAIHPVRLHGQTLGICWSVATSQPATTVNATNQFVSLNLQIPKYRSNIMAKKMLAHLVATKTLIRVAFSILSLSGVAHAESSAHPTTPGQSASAYNYMAGGGG